MILNKIKTTVYRHIAFFIQYGIYRTRLGRNKYIKEETLGSKLCYKEELTIQEKDVIRDIWRPITTLKKIDWDFYSVYKGIAHPADIAFYIPDSIWYCFIDLFLTNPRRSYALDDKNLYDRYYHDIKMPRTICHIMGGVLLSPDYKPISLEQAIDLCKNEKHIIIKKSIDSEGGKGISFWDIKTDSDDSLKQLLVTEQNVIIQEIISQHETLAKLHTNSLNTIRIMTLFIHGEVKILSSVVRMGVGDSKVDNASSGGIVCGIKENGQLRDFACNTKGDIFRVRHPQGCRFEDVTIPNFKSCCDIVKKLAILMNAFSKLISWDLAIDKHGNPVLIENNLTFGQLDFHQICNGPILGNDLNFIQEVFNYVNNIKINRSNTLKIQR